MEHKFAVLVKIDAHEMPFVPSSFFYPLVFTMLSAQRLAFDVIKSCLKLAVEILEQLCKVCSEPMSSTGQICRRVNRFSKVAPLGSLAFHFVHNMESGFARFSGVFTLLLLEFALGSGPRFYAPACRITSYGRSTEQIRSVRARIDTSSGLVQWPFVG